VAFLWNPVLSGIDLLHAIHAEFGLSEDGKTIGQLNDQLNRFLLQRKQEDRRVLLIIDEAQNLTEKTLEQIRLLSNLETDRSKLLQIVLLGQPELETQLAREELRQLRQRIGVWWRLAPLLKEETEEYIAHRLRVASGGRRADLFTAAALREVYRASEGIPRLINGICDRALLAAYADGLNMVDVSEVRQAANERCGAGIVKVIPSPRSWLGKASFAALAVGVCAFAVLAWGALNKEAFARNPFFTPLKQTDSPEMSSKVLETTTSPPTLASGILGIDGSERTNIDVAAAPPLLVTDLNGGFLTESEPLPVEASEIDEADLTDHLIQLSPGISYAHVLNSLFETWGEEAPAERALSISAVLTTLEARGYSVLWLQGADLGTLEALDHPPILLLQALDGVQRAALLQGVTEDHVVLMELGSDQVLYVPQELLEAHWSGDAFVPWRDFEGLPEVVHLGRENAWAVRWLQRRLQNLGFYVGLATGEWDEATRKAVLRYQSHVGLEADGNVGPRTKMALYAAYQDYPIPRLSTVTELNSDDIASDGLRKDDLGGGL
jgi:general secretion pathway protein A